ncbi:MAG: hypothetical protein QOF25_2260 [Mycobacterium sp.]|jgi:hypothetical protein|nr:hypothetical protein [Mycobacterium sp.]
MNRPLIAIGGVTAAALLTAGMTIGGSSSAAAQPGDYSAIPVSPNVITDSTAYTAAAPMINPNGQPGVTTVYTHRDNTRQVTNTILVLPDPEAATNAISEIQSGLGNRVTNGKTQPAAVGTGGTVVTGTSPDGTKSVSLLMFTEGNAAGSIEFEGPKNDSVPLDLVVDYGQKQDTAIKDSLTT